MRKKRQPALSRNVLLLLVDDLSTRLGCYGHPLVRSPNLDRLAARGVRFERAYCQAPSCNASRTSLLSGRRPATTGVFSNDTHPRTNLKNAVFLPEYFWQHGYFTARAGKVAHDEPGTAFEEAIAWDQVESVLAPPPGTAGAPLSSRPTEGRDEDQPDGRLAQAVIRLLEQPRRRPFFLAAGFRKPHPPFVAPRQYFDLYPHEAMRLHGDRDKAQLQALRGYYACVSFVDAQVGLILDALDRLRLEERTVVILCSDHGCPLGAHGTWRDDTLFTEATRVPLLVVTPGESQGTVSPRLAELVDLYPTLAELCGLPAPAGVQGTSLAPLLKQPSRPWKTAAFTEVQRGSGLLGRAVHTERSRYAEWEDAETGELYDLQADPHEHTNLVHEAAQAHTVTELRRLLQQGWQGAAPTVSNGNPRPASSTPNTVLLQSTFTCLLEITLGAGHRLLNVRALHDRHGVYFGLTRHGDSVYAVARNVDVHNRVPDPGTASHNIMCFPWPWRGQPPRLWSIPGTTGVHQIRFHDGLVWLLNCQHPELLAFDPDTGTVAGTVALAELVPEALRHEPPHELPLDRYHFNALHFAGGRLFVLAYNHGYPSFALELDYAGPVQLFRQPQLIRVHPNLGLYAHDIYHEGDELIVLDSGNGRLLATNDLTHRIGPPYAHRHCFARGLAVSREFFYVGHGTFSSPARRVNGPTQITVIDRQHLETAAVIDIGPYGNPCDLLLMSEPDWSDLSAPPAQLMRPPRRDLAALAKRLGSCLCRWRLSKRSVC